MKPGTKKRERLLIISNQQKGKNKQSGVVLLLLVIALALTFTTYYFSNISLTDINVDNVKKTRLALKQAKQALLNYASIETYIDSLRAGKYGFLPCPDYVAAFQEGVQDGNCGATNVSQIGWLPSITLELPYNKDSIGSCLLYAVSGMYKQSPETAMLNEDSNGFFQTVDDTVTPVKGLVPGDRVVAIIFSPGDVLPGQVRTFLAGSNCGGDYANEDDYLEGDGITDNSTVSVIADSIDQFIHATPASNAEAVPYNDRFITISREELWGRISTSDVFISKMRNLTKALAECIFSYAKNNAFDRLPYPAPMDLTDYRVNINYDDRPDDTSGYAGRLPFVVANSNTIITVGGVNDLFTQGTCDIANGISQDLNIAGSEYRILWQNWKDHFFYVVSKDFAPAATAASCGGNCITVDGIQRAGVVIFSGSRLGAQVRTGPVGPAGLADANTKQNIKNYLENGNEDVFPDFGGNGAYVKVTPANSNDIMFCITDTSPRKVVDCTL